MSRLESVQAVLNAFLSLFTQPFEQDLKASMKAAATSISLAGLVSASLAGFEGLGLLANGGSRTTLEFGRSSLILVLVWMFTTAVFTKVERGLRIARNLNVLSFWIAVTLVLVLAMERVFPGPLDRAIRLLSVSVVLLVFVPVHMFRNLPISSALPMTLVLWLSTGALAWTVFY